VSFIVDNQQPLSAERSRQAATDSWVPVVVEVIGDNDSLELEAVFAEAIGIEAAIGRDSNLGLGRTKRGRPAHSHLMLTVIAAPTTVL
jgi:hypothetical protein